MNCYFPFSAQSSKIHSLLRILESIRKLHSVVKTITLISDMRDDLQRLANVIESLSHTDATADDLAQQVNQIEILIEQFETKISALTSKERRKSSGLINDWRLKFKLQCDTVKRAMDAVENGLLTDGENGSTEVTSENTETHFNSNQDIEMENSREPIDSENNASNTIKMPESREINPSDLMEVCETSNDISTQQKVTDELSDTNATSSDLKGSEGATIVLCDRSKNMKATQTSDTEVVIRDTLADSIRTNEGFSYVSLIMFSAAINELNALREMPETSAGKDFRYLREFISRFTLLCNEMKIGMRQLEPIMLTFIIRSFNEKTRNAWEIFMRKHTATSRTMQQFLADEEEAALDKSKKIGCDLLAKAIQIANAKLSSPSAQPKVSPINHVKPNRAIEPTPSCSGSNQLVQQIRDKSLSRSSETSLEKSNVRKKWVCLSCEGPHPLYWCTDYLAKTLPDRWELVKRENICPLCLMAKHEIEKCHDEPCKQCGTEAGMHNSTLCAISVSRRRTLQKREKPVKKGG